MLTLPPAGSGRVIFLPLTMFAITASLLLAQTETILKDPQKLASQSTFVFRGHVQKLNGSTVPILRPSPSTAIVRVDKIIESPPNLSGYAGKEITVELAGPNPSIKEGAEAVFFTNGWLLGDGVAVREVTHSETLSGESATSLLATGRANAQDNALKNDVSSADAVVAGRVLKIETPEKLSEAATETDPGWKKAILEVSQVLKGSVHTKTVTVLFPTSVDVRWISKPRFQTDQTGIWLLHPIPRSPYFKAAAPAANTFTALHRSDFHNSDELQKIESIIKGGAH